MMQPASLSQQYTNFDVKMEWDIKIIDRKTVIDGLIRNIRYSKMEDIEIWVKHLDANGKTVARAVDLVMPRQLDLNAVASFTVILLTIVPHSADLVFTYKYNGYDGGDGSNWMQSFESKRF